MATIRIGERNRERDLPETVERAVREGKAIPIEEDGFVRAAVVPVEYLKRLEDMAAAGRGALARDASEREKLLRTIFEQMPGTAYRRTLHTDGRISYSFISSGVKTLLGYDVQELTADPSKLTENIHPEDREKRARAIRYSSRTLERYDEEYRYVLPSGETVWIRAIADPVRLDNGDVVWTGLTLDVTDRKRLEEELVRARDALERDVQKRTAELRSANEALRAEVAERREAEEAMRESRDRLNLITNNLPALIAYVDADERYKFVNKCCCDWYARPYEDIIGLRVEEIHKSNYATMFAKRFAQVEERGIIEFDARITYPDGVTRDTRSTWLAHRDPDGTLVGVYSLVEDMTAFRLAEERARQSQKMEAVGQLTGGVAHDFNNLLAVIIGNAEMLVEDLGDDPSPKAILRAARRGVELTQRLLAFSRRQPLDPVPTALNKLVAGMKEILRRTLGETISIEVSAEDGLWPVMADPGQVENALLNLAINARDAMPGGGNLTIECLNVRLDEETLGQNTDAQAGDFAVLAVSDNGSGMPGEVLEHVFEPFFTTKEVGQGTGLGLSMIYGFARQSGGHVSIYSEKGTGTTVKLYLPRALDAAAHTPEADAADLPKGRGETVLVVEDDADVRELTVNVVRKLGYRVIEAAEAESARTVLQTEYPVDLLLSDVVLPGKLSGPAFAREALRACPGLKILFMSGYPAEAARRNGFPDLAGPLLKKPVDRRELAEALRSALEG